MGIEVMPESAGEIAYLLEIAKEHLYSCRHGEDGRMCNHCKIWLLTADDYMQDLDYCVHLEEGEHQPLGPVSYNQLFE